MQFVAVSRPTMLHIAVTMAPRWFRFAILKTLSNLNGKQLLTMSQIIHTDDGNW